MTMGSGRQKVRKSYLAKALGVHRLTVLRRSIRRSCRIALKRRNRDGSYSGFPMVENNSPCLIARRLIFNRASCRLFPSLHCSRIGFQLRYELIEGGLRVRDGQRTSDANPSRKIENLGRAPSIFATIPFSGKAEQST
jgi:hypothetical protein